MLLPLRIALLAGLALGDGGASSSPASRPAGAALVSRPVVIGASASAGFRLSDPSAPLLGDAIDRLIAARHDRVATFASSLFFLSPSKTGKEQVDRAARVKPSVVFALDYLFWFLYGFFEKEEDRLVLLDKGLANLARLEAPVVVAEIPDMAPSIGKMLDRKQVPSAETIDDANRRIRAWAAERPGVTVVALPQFLQRLRSGKRLEIRGNVWREGSTKALLQRDDLHPTLEGTVALALLALDALANAHAELKEGSLRWEASAAVAELQSAESPPESAPSEDEGAPASRAADR
ncbi:MAG TPA: hypothetical protein VKE69_12660 [Planctomycetota bacterium]|nr:hypothetical protein [Planctomycetota bacterium]